MVIFYKFNQIPKNLAFDEVEFAKLALSLQNKPYAPYSPLATGHSTLYFYIILLSFKIFGISNIGLRLPAAFFGVGSCLLFYLILKKTGRFSDLLSLLGALILTTTHWFINFSKFSFEATFLLFLELFSIYFLIVFFKKKTNFFLILSAVFAGFAFNSYTSGRIFFLLPSLLLIKKPKKLLLFCAIVLIIIAPLSLYLKDNKDIRVDQQLFLKNNQISIAKKFQFLGENIAANLLMFNIKGDLNGKHNFPGKPALNPILGLFFISGLIIALINSKNFSNYMFISYFLMSLFPSILTYPQENPHMLRTFTSIISAIYFIILSIDFIIKKRKQFLLPLILLLFFSSIYEVRTYYKYQATVFKNSFEIKSSLEKILKK